jgi:hypothetical protein
MSKRDPLASLIEYVGVVKPYHTKVYEVILEYVYTEPVRATINERYEIYIEMTTDSNKFFVVPGVGWDTGPYDADQWDYPHFSDAASPSRILTAISEQLQMFIDMNLSEEILTYANLHSMGWDMTAFDEQGFDSENMSRLAFEQQDNGEDSVGATIIESLSIQVI